VASGTLTVFIDLVQEGGYLQTLHAKTAIEILNSPNTTTIIIPCLLIAGLIIGSFSSQLARLTLIQRLLSVTAPFVLVLAILPDSDLGLNLEFWSGYGVAPAAISVSCFLMILILNRFLSDAYSNAWNFFLKLSKIASYLIVLIYLPIFLQPPNGLLNFGDTSYHVVDELLAQYSGKLPYSDYSPQYTGVLGWLLFPLRLVQLDGKLVMNCVILACNLFGFFLPIAATLMIKKLYPAVSTSLVLAACVTTSFASGTYNGSSTMLKEFSFSARLVPIFATILAVIVLLLSEPDGANPKAALLGILNALSILNNADVGLAFGLIILLVLVIVTSTNLLQRSVAITVLLWCSGTIIFYYLLGFALGRPVRWESYWGLRASSPRILYESFPLHAFGAHLIVMTVCMASIAMGIRIVRDSEKGKREAARATVYLAFGGLLVAMLVRFAIRPIPHGIGGVMISAFVPGTMLVLDGIKSIQNHWNQRTLVSALPLLLIALLPVGAVWQFPNPVDELHRISGSHYGTSDWSSTPGRMADGYSIEALTQTTPFIDYISSAERALPTDSTIGYFGIYGHTVQLLTGITNLMGIPAPESLRFGDGQKKLACLPINESAKDFILIYGSSFPCRGYALDTKYSTSFILVYRKT
jgi:hypothetical protein